MMVIDNKYNLGQVVFLHTDPDQLRRIVTQINILSGGVLIYGLSQCGSYSEHTEVEISKNKILQI